MTIKGHYSNGVIVPDEPLPLVEGAVLEFSIAVLGNSAVIDAVEAARQELSRDIGQVDYVDLLPYLGTVKDAPSDGSQNVDHYLYGHPKP